MTLKRLATLALVSGLVVTTSCVDGDRATGPVAGTAHLAIVPGLAPALAPPPGQISRIRIVAEVQGSGTALSTFSTDVDPTLTEWPVAFDVPVPVDGSDVILLVELLSVSGGVETIEWSGQIGPMTLVVGGSVRVTQVDLLRGPPGNLAVSALQVTPATTTVLEGDTTRLVPEITTSDPDNAPMPFWTSLDLTASVDQAGLVTGLLPGSARIVAEAGVAADTAVVTVAPTLLAQNFSALGNTQLVIGGYSSPPSTIAIGEPTGLLDGTPTLTAVAGTVATSLGGTAVVEASGAALYTPPIGVTGSTDVFYYHVTTGDSAAVSVDLTGRVWYIDNTQAGTGTSDSPAAGFSAISGVEGPNDVIYVATGSGSYANGKSLLTGQQVVGEGVALTVSGFGTIAGAGAPPTFQTGGLPAFTMADGSALSGVTIAAGASNAVVAQGVSNVNVDAVSIADPLLHGLYLQDLGGTNSFGNLTISSANTAIGVEVFGGTGLIDVQGTVSVTAGQLIQVDSTQAGSSVIFTGTFSALAADTAIRVVDPAGDIGFDIVDIGGSTSSGVNLRGVNGNVTFASLDVDSTTFEGFNVTGGSGTVDVTVATGGWLQFSSQPLTFQSLAGAKVAFGGGPVTVTGGRGVYIDNAAAGSQVTFGNLLDLRPPIGSGITFQNSLGNATFTNAEIHTSRVPGIYAVANTDGVSAFGTLDVSGSVVVADTVGVQVASSGFTANLDTLMVTNNTANAGAVAIDTSPGIKSIAYLNAESNGPLTQTFYAFEGGTINVTDPTSRIVSTAGTALLFSGETNNTTVAMTLADLSSTTTAGSFADGVSLNHLAGTLTVTGGTITNAGGDFTNGFYSSNNTADITYGGTIDNTAGPAITVTSHTGGSVTFSGPVNSSAKGISGTNNASTALRFTNKITMSTDTAAAFVMDTNTGSTVEVTGAGSTITTTTGTPVTIRDTDIGPGGVTFQSISALRSVNGILLSNTGTGLFYVTGAGAAGSGGTLQSTTADGVIATAAGLHLTYMNILGATNAGVNLSQTTGAVLEGLTITGGTVYGVTTQDVADSLVFDGTNVTSAPTANAIMAQTGGSAVVRMRNSRFDNGGYGAWINVTSTGAVNLNASNTTFTGNSNAGLVVQASATGVLDFVVDGSSMSNNAQYDLLTYGQGTAQMTGLVQSSTIYGGPYGIYNYAAGTAGSLFNFKLDGSSIDGPSGAVGATAAVFTYVGPGAAANVTLTNSDVVGFPRAVDTRVGDGQNGGALDLVMDGDSLSVDGQNFQPNVVSVLSDVNSTVCTRITNTDVLGYDVFDWLFTANTGATLGFLNFTGDPATTLTNANVRSFSQATGGWGPATAQKAGGGTLQGCIVP